MRGKNCAGAPKNFSVSEAKTLTPAIITVVDSYGLVEFHYNHTTVIVITGVVASTTRNPIMTIILYIRASALPVV